MCSIHCISLHIPLNCALSKSTPPATNRGYSLKSFNILLSNESLGISKFAASTNVGKIDV